MGSVVGGGGVGRPLPTGRGHTQRAGPGGGGQLPQHGRRLGHDLPHDVARRERPAREPRGLAGPQGEHLRLVADEPRPRVGRRSPRLARPAQGRRPGRLEDVDQAVADAARRPARDRPRDHGVHVAGLAEAPAVGLRHAALHGPQEARAELDALGAQGQRGREAPPVHHRPRRHDRARPRRAPPAAPGRRSRPAAPRRPRGGRTWSGGRPPRSPGPRWRRRPPPPRAPRPPPRRPSRSRRRRRRAPARAPAAGRRGPRSPPGRRRRARPPPAPEPRPRRGRGRVLGHPSSHRSGASAVRGSVPRGSGGVGGATRTLIAIGAAVRARARATASDAASAVMPLSPKAPSPPASETAATSSGVVGPPAIPASSTGWRIPSSAQSRFANGESVSARDIRVPKSQATSARHRKREQAGPHRIVPSTERLQDAPPPARAVRGRCCRRDARRGQQRRRRDLDPPLAPGHGRAGARRERARRPVRPPPSARRAGNHPDL